MARVIVLFQILAIIAPTVLALTSSKLAPVEPPDGSILFGAWWNNDERPAKMNSRLGISKNMSLWQTVKELGVGATQPFDLSWDIALIEETNTDAALHVVVFPMGLTSSFIRQKDLDSMVSQLNQITSHGRKVMIRYGSEMNGYWFPAYSRTPSLFISNWRIVANAIYNGVKPRSSVAMVWAPMVNANSGWGPYNKELDTNHDGKLDARDDPYTPYYPGDEWVDFVGLSMYHFGGTGQNHNTLPQPNQWEQMLLGTLQYAPPFNFYDMFCVKRGKPLMIAETSAAFHVQYRNGSYISPGPGQLKIKQGWWRQFLNPTILRKYPKLKAINFFDFKKAEGDSIRDFRVFIDTENIYSQLSRDVGAIANFLVQPKVGQFISGLVWW